MKQSLQADAKPDAPVLDLDPFLPECLADPYPFHRALREAGPVAWLAPYGIWAVGRFTEVRAVLSDWETYCSSAGVGLANYHRETPWRPPGLLLEADPPVHDHARRVLARVLSPVTLRTLRAGFELEAVALVDELVTRGSIDGMADLAERFPLKVFSDAVGLPLAGRDNLLPYGKVIFNAFGPRNALFEGSMTDLERLQAWVTQSCRREALAPNSLGAQIYAAADAGEITQDEAPRLVRAFLSAGLDTTVSALGNALHLFAQFPDEWARVTADPELVKNAFEEVLRFETPFQAFFRTTTKDAVLARQRLGAGEKILVSIAAANRDPRQWSDPDRFDVMRRAAGHMAFGFGIHACVGQMMARLEGEVLLTALTQKVARIELAGEPERRFNNTLRGFKTLPLMLVAAGD
jgi:4-methoxybenzoate monooxygenase (O-demethylating)